MKSLFMYKFDNLLKAGLSIFFLIIFLSTSAEKPLTHSATTEENGRVYQYSIIYQEYSIKVKPAVTYYWHRNGQLHSTSGDYSGNILHGISQEFDKSGRMLAKGSYYLGTKDGLWKSWDRNGNIICLELWARGYLHWKKSYESSKYTIENYRKNQLNGKKITWINGKRESVEHFKNGKKCTRNKISLNFCFPNKKQKEKTDGVVNK